MRFDTADPKSGRPPDYDYHRELMMRFGAIGHHMLNLDSVGNSTEQRRPYKLAEGVAIINISGVLVNEGWWWDETEYGEIRSEIKQALDDSEVNSILLRVNSPGGESDGAFETAAFIEQAAQKKRIWAVADLMAYSAAYLLSTHADKIYVPPISGGVGSIGVYALHLDLSGMLEKEGVKATFITAGAGKAEGNRLQPLSKAAHARIQEKVDRLYSEFVGNVSRGRGISEEKCRQLGAYCYDGARSAVDAGLADVAGSLEDAWKGLVVEGSTNTFPAATAAKTAEAPAKDRIQEDREVPMDKEETAGASKQGTAKTYSQADVDALLAAAKAAPANPPPTPAPAPAPDAAQELRDIVALCSDFGRPELANDFIAKKMSRADAQKELARLRVAADAAETDAHVKPAADADKKPFVSPAMLHSAVDKLVQQMKGGA